jgi:hypothetical protein
MTNGDDFIKVPRALKVIVKRYLGMELVEMKNGKSRPPLPFATYDVVNPYIPQSHHNSPADGFSIEVQIGIHGAQPQFVLQNALELRAQLERSSVINALATLGIHFEKIIDVYNRPTLLAGEAYEYISGIDLQLGLDVSLAPDDAEPIEQLGIFGMNGQDISI